MNEIQYAFRHNRKINLAIKDCLNMFYIKKYVFGTSLIKHIHLCDFSLRLTEGIYTINVFVNKYHNTV